MALKDFVTLTEMKHGLDVPRVEELVAVINKENVCSVKNVRDAIRQWSAVAMAIAATKNKGCLDLFIRLGGLLFIDRWLKETQKFSEDSCDSLVEELILALLHTLDKLGVGNEQLISSGIFLTLKDLLSHTSLNIQDKAKTFIGNQKAISTSGIVELDLKEANVVSSQPGNSIDVESAVPKLSSATSSDQKADVDQHPYEIAGNIAAPARSCINQQSAGVEAVVEVPSKLATRFSECDLKEEDEVEYSVKQEACSSERNSMSDTPNLRRKMSASGSVLEVTNSETSAGNLPNEFGKVECKPAAIMAKPVEESLAVSENHAIEPDRNGGKGTDDQIDSSTLSSMSAELPGTTTRADDRGVLMNCTVMLAQKTPSIGDVNSSNSLQASPIDGFPLRKSQDLDKTVDRVKHNPRQLRSSRVFDSSRNFNRVDVTSKTSAIGLEYGMVDALAVACLVAKEVERQVTEDCDEHFDNVDALNGKTDQHAEGSPSSSESLAEKLSVECSTGEDEDEPLGIHMDAEQENGTGAVESSQATEAAPEVGNNSMDKGGASDFDLNLEICSEATEEDAGGNCVPNLVSNPVAIASASKAVAVPGLPLKFEGALGWKGSASTSAFRPASPRRIDQLQLVHSEAATNGGSREGGGKGCVFDLNFADDSVVAAEPCPSRSENLGFDLNLMSEDSEAPPFSLSIKSSSPPRNFDLNDDNPLTFSETSNLLPCVGASNDSVISIMGARVKQKTFAHQAPYSFFNEPVVDPGMGRPGPSFAPSSIYGYNGVAVGPAMSFSPAAMYGGHGGGSPAAYMVDPRVMMAAAPPPPPPAFSFPHQPSSSYTANMVGPLQLQGGSNGVSPFRPHLDFNPRFVMDGPSNRVDAGSFRQFYPGQSRTAAEVQQLQPLFPGPVIGGKRKEPEGGWGEFHHHPHPPHPHL